MIHRRERVNHDRFVFQKVIWVQTLEKNRSREF
jgi:hypothetical protein